ncbi:DUF4253 domain-containing protein [Gimesia maris]|uniref:DUF4253 domain-containing protein n=1 Tax=Gimesia maris TaxID=122 RepID=UPI00241C51D9|nr:DUF4253 domain-containing protein [Gimesia maris]|tara:strand:+ start:236675 stop:237349 length:675 start_codon:yes stop_codon:yes gene_type:complete
MTFTSIQVHGTEAVERLNELRDQFAKTGKYPFLIGPHQDRETMIKSAEFNRQSPEEILRASQKIDLEEWVAERRAEVEEYGYSPYEDLGEWPGEIQDKGSFILHKNAVTGNFLPEVFIGLAQVETSWQLPAVLKFGGWNDCPDAEVQCAFHRKWQAEFGAEICSVGGGVIECTVNQPPQDQQSAMQLAWEQYWYCADIVDQGCETISNLGATLLKSPYWFFWWD